MKKLYPDAEDVSQSVANRTARIVERHLRQAQVDRAKDLPEEAKVRLFRDLRAFFEAEGGSASGASGSERSREGLWARLLRRLEDFLSFSDLEPNVYLPFAYCASMPFCDGVRQMSVPMIKRAVANSQPREARRGKL